MPTEWTFALLGFENVPGRITCGWPIELDRLRHRIIAELLRRHEIGGAVSDVVARFVDRLDPRDWPKPGKPGEDLFLSQAGFRTPLDVAELWGLDWLERQLRTDIRLETEACEPKKIPQLCAAVQAAGALIRIKSAAIGGYYAPAGKDPTTGRPIKATLLMQARAWENLLRKLGQLAPVLVLPVQTVHAPAPRAPAKPSKPRLVHSRPPTVAKTPSEGLDGAA